MTASAASTTSITVTSGSATETGTTQNINKWLETAKKDIQVAQGKRTGRSWPRWAEFSRNMDPNGVIEVKYVPVLESNIATVIFK